MFTSDIEIDCLDVLKCLLGGLNNSSHNGLEIGCHQVHTDYLILSSGVSGKLTELSLSSIKSSDELLNICEDGLLLLLIDETDLRDFVNGCKNCMCSAR